MIQPDYPSAMGLLAHLNSDELKEMLNDDTKFDSVLKDVKQVKQRTSFATLLLFFIFFETLKTATLAYFSE